MTDHPITPPLRLADAALAAFNDRHELCGPFEDDWVEQCLAAAIEALAVHAGRGLFRSDLLAIAAELRGDTIPTEPNGQT